MESKVFTEYQFGRMIEKLFVEYRDTFTGWQYNLTVIYTHGRDINWPSTFVSPSANGLMTDAFTDDKEKILYGAALIDIRACVPKHLNAGLIRTGSNIIEFRKPTLFEYKKSVLLVLAHEIYHMIQFWLEGNRLFSYVRYGIEFIQTRNRLKREHPEWDRESLTNQASTRMPMEAQAENASKEHVGKLRTEIQAGEWDKYIPVQDIEYYFDQR
jgi:hypothetical protein